jgi:membrane protein
VTSALFSVCKFLIATIFRKKQHCGQLAGGAAGSLVTILLWVYYSGVIFLFGAETTRIYAKEYGSGSGQGRSPKTRLAEPGQAGRVKQSPRALNRRKRTTLQRAA